VRHYDYEACAIIDGDIARTEAHTDEDIVREVRNKNGKLDPDEGGGGGGGENTDEAEREKTERKNQLCQFPV
jgi:hypothetical protein